MGVAGRKIAGAYWARTRGWFLCVPLSFLCLGIFDLSVRTPRIALFFVGQSVWSVATYGKWVLCFSSAGICLCGRLDRFDVAAHKSAKIPAARRLSLSALTYFQRLRTPCVSRYATCLRAASITPRVECVKFPVALGPPKMELLRDAVLAGS